MEWFSDQISLENVELNNIKQFLKVKKRSVESYQSLYRTNEHCDSPGGAQHVNSPGAWDHETTCGFVFFLKTPVDCPLKLPWAMLPAHISIRMSGEGG